LTVRGRHVRYRVTGPADAPRVLLLHGVTRSLEDWNEQHELLSGQYRVISVDLPGFGHSQRLREPVSLAGLARFVEDFLDEIGVPGPVHVAGNSLGGAVAMQLAVQAPDRVRSLLLANSAGFGREVTPTLRILGVRPRAVAKAMLRPNRTVALQAERSIFHDPSFATPERVDLAYRLSARPEGADAMLDTLGSLGGLRGVHAAWRAELLPAVAALAHPTLVVWGDDDRILPAKHLLAAREALPHAQWHLFPATGHMPQIERAEEFATLAREFWSSDEPDPQSGSQSGSASAPEAAAVDGEPETVAGQV
jgi:pimeloyl-ACP methyl ester carboxylesterase